MTYCYERIRKAFSKPFTKEEWEFLKKIWENPHALKKAMEMWRTDESVKLAERR